MRVDSPLEQLLWHVSAYDHVMLEVLAMGFIVVVAVLLFTLQYWAVVWYSPDGDDDSEDA